MKAPPSTTARRTIWAELAGYGFAAALCLILLTVILELPRMHLRVPLNYSEGKDVLPLALAIKDLNQHGTLYTHPQLAAPFGANWSDWPVTELLHIAMLTALGWLTPNFGAVVNLFFLATFPLAMLSALWVLRHFGIPWPAAIAAAILYAFLPYHFSRATHHLSLSAYFLVPLAVAVAVWVAEGRELIAIAQRRITISRPFGCIALATCLLTAISGVYYAFFAVFFLGVAAFIATARQRSWRAWITPFILAATISITVWLTLLPTRIYAMRHGPNTEAVKRHAIEPEFYSLRITQLLLPSSQHRLAVWRSLKSAYNRALGSPWINENDSATLGLVGAGGFLFLIGVLLWRSPGVLGHLALLNVCGVVLASASGMGAFIAVLLGEILGTAAGGYIRGYNRISVYIAFFALAAVALAITAVYRKFQARAWAAPALYLSCAGMLAGGLYDQVPLHPAPVYENDRAAYIADAQFVQQIESRVPRDAMIFQLPYMPFPEAGGQHNMPDYEPLRPALHSDHLRWSYGGMKGRAVDVWYRETARETDTAKLVERIALAGFAGIYVDRAGYADNGAEGEQQLRTATGRDPVVRADGRFTFFDLAPVRQLLTNGTPPEELRRKQEQALEALVLESGPGCYSKESNERHTWHWCEGAGSLRVHNPGTRERRVRLSMTFALGDRSNERIEVTSPSLPATVQVNPAQPVDTELKVPPGGVTVRFRTRALPLRDPNDPRVLVLQVMDPRVEPVEK